MSFFKKLHPAAVLELLIFVLYCVFSAAVGQLFIHSDYVSAELLENVISPLSLVWLSFTLLLMIRNDLKKHSPVRSSGKRALSYFVILGCLLCNAVFVLSSFEIVPLSYVFHSFIGFMISLLPLSLWILVQDAKNIQKDRAEFQAHPKDKVIIPIALLLASSLFVFLARSNGLRYSDDLSQYLIVSILGFAVFIFLGRCLIDKLERKAKLNDD